LYVSGIAGQHLNSGNMKKTFEEPLLNQPITELNFSEPFKKLAKKCRCQTLGAILQLPGPGSLLQHKGFRFRQLMEFTRMLTENDLGGYLLHWQASDR
jgi:hypothetical protein